MFCCFILVLMSLGMPHVKSACETMDEFVAVHKMQLQSSGIPEHYWEKLFIKLKDEVFDAGESFMIQQVEEQLCSDDEDEENDDETGNDVMRTTLESSMSWQVVVTKPGGISVKDPKQIYLVDHAWTYRLDQARNHLETMHGLLPRMSKLLGVETAGRQQFDVVEDVLTVMWRYNQTYNIGAAELGTDAGVPLWYIMDEFGSRIQHSDCPNVRMVPFCYVPSQIAFTILWPVCDMDEGDEVTRDYLDGCAADPLLRKLLLLPWKPDDMSHLSYEQHEDDELFLRKYSVHESLPHVGDDFPCLPRDRNVKVYTDVDQVLENLTDPRFDHVSTVEEADIIWTKHYLKDFKTFSEETPNKFINQFPFEMVLTVKSVLPVVCRRGITPVVDPETLDTFPSWLPITFNLKTEMAEFVSYFQHREMRGLDNHWICKPFNLSRGLDTTVTNNIACVLRLSQSGPKIVSKYVEDPVLLDRDDVGPVKFDLRFIVMVTSVHPMQIAVHQKFIVRVANKVFSLDHLDDYEKHFTVMNYRKDTPTKQIQCEEFIELFNLQYPDITWEKVQGEIYDVIRKAFAAAASELPPKGIGHSPQSRAVYGVDIMLKWHKVGDASDKTVLPVLLEVNFGPDNTRLVRAFQTFYNDVFSALFLHDIAGRPVTPL